MKTILPLSAGRLAFGDQPAAYHAARPDYPDELYDVLAQAVDLDGRAVFEIGPGSGLATSRLLARGPARLTAIEPDPRMAAFLAARLAAPALEILNTTFEAAILSPGGYDLGVAATAFHWLDQPSALAKVFGALRPGGSWSMWWTNFGAEFGDDAFQRATDRLFAEVPDSPSQGRPGGPPFSLDRAARLTNLADAGFEALETRTWRWMRVLPTPRLLALYATFSNIHAMAPARRARFLAAIARVADEDFGGQVERPFTTVLYTARRPG